MRIAMLTNNYKPFIGGVPISIERLSEGLRALGHEVYIFAPSYENQEEEPYVMRYKTWHKKLKGEMIIPHGFDSDIERYFELLDFDVIHVHHPMLAGWMGTYLGKKYNIPVAYTYHTRYEQYLHYMKLFAKWEQKSPNSSLLKGIKTKFLPSLIKSYTNQCEVVFAPTQMMKELLEAMEGKTSIRILPTGLSSKFFVNNHKKATEIRGRYSGNSKYLFCTVSRLSKEKNIQFILEGLQELKAQIGDCFKMLIIGDGPDKEALVQHTHMLGLENNISFVDSVPNDEISHYYNACDLFLFASKSETQGIVLLEAMAARNPVIAIKASGVVEVVKNGENGYMTEDDVLAWASAIRATLENETLFEQMKDQAYNTACHYKSEKVATMAEQYYQQAVVEKRIHTEVKLQKGHKKHKHHEDNQGEGAYYV